MKVIDISYRVSEPPDRVFAQLVDLRQLASWRSLEGLQVEPDGPVRPGTRLVTKVKGPTGLMTFTNEVTVVDHVERDYDDRFLEGTFPIESGWRVLDVDGGSEIRWVTRYQGRGVMGLLGPLLGTLIRRGQLADLKKFEALLKT